MEMKVFSALGILALMIATNMVMGLQKCSCSSTTWDCSFRGKSIIFPEDICNANNWLLHHNYLGAIPTPSYHLNAVDVSYNSLGLNESALVYFPNVNYLDLSSNYLKSLEIVGRSIIGTLVANDNEISSIEIIDIFGNNSLRVSDKLILARNKITSLPQIPNSYSSLTHIDFSGNPLCTISVEAFKSRTNLKILHLNSTKTLSELENGTFHGLSSLQILSLNDNKLMHLGEDLFTSLENLEELFLNVNNLSELPLGIFRKLYNLRLLNLDNNKLTELPEELFSRLHSLEDLSVRSNYLKTLPVLRLCAGPISTVVFTDNLIERIDEIALRGLLRIGFSYGDLSDNRIENASLSWTDGAEDISLRRTSTRCQTIEMSKIM
ncbi:Toll-like receptor 6 [Gryllus bimaculatus]|nr:Toll-like receptor 6 [Gryllus bimaculatus]